MSVYFAKVGRYIKVGFSEDPERRVARLWRSGTRYGRPWDLSVKEKPVLLASIEGELDVEFYCHEALADFRAGLEWFIDEPEVRDFIPRAALGDYSRVQRPGGPFVPVGHEAALPERLAEIDRMLDRARAKARSA